jgi:hypothetical protein
MMNKFPSTPWLPEKSECQKIRKRPRLQTKERAHLFFWGLGKIVMLPDIIEVRELRGGMRYLLPPRQCGRLRFRVGLPLILLGLSGSIMILYLTGVELGQAMQAQNGQLPLLGLLLALKLLPAGVVCFIPFLFGLAIFAGRLEVQLCDGKLWAFERVGPFCWSRSRTVARIRQLIVFGPSANGYDPSMIMGPVAEMALLMGECEGTGVMAAARRCFAARYPSNWHLALAKAFVGPSRGAAILAACEGEPPLLVAAGYPHAWLAALAEELVGRCQAELPSGAPGPRRAVPHLVARYLHDWGAQDQSVQPARSQAVLESQGGELVLRLPPCGVWQGHGEEIFRGSLLLVGLLAVVGLGVLTATIIGVCDPELGICLVLFLIPFAVLVLGLLLHEIDRGRSQACFAVVGGCLVVARFGVFRTRRYEWPRAQIRAIRAAYRPSRYDHRPVLELQILSRGAQTVGLFSGRDHAELRWVATVLRQALQVPAVPEQ